MRELPLLEVARAQQGDFAQGAVAGDQVGGHALSARESEPLEDGQVIEDVDRSNQVAALRRRLSSQELRPEDEAAQEEIQKAIAECFSRDYMY